MVSGINLWLPVSLLIALIILCGLLFLATLLIYKLCRNAMAYRAQTECDTKTLMHELLYARTLADTGNHQAAADILRHSDAHDRRTNRPEIHVPIDEPQTQEPEEMSVSPTYEMGVDRLP